MIETWIFLFVFEHPIASALMLAAMLWWALRWRLIPGRELARLWGRAAARLFTH